MNVTTPKFTACSPKPLTTPRNSRLVMESWLNSTPSPSSPFALREKDMNASKDDDKTAKKPIVLCVKPSSMDRKNKRRKSTKSPAQLFRRSVKRKLEKDKGNPPREVSRKMSNEENESSNTGQSTSRTIKDSLDIAETSSENTDNVKSKEEDKKGRKKNESTNKREE